MKWYWVFVIAVVSDVLDFLGGSIPLLGDVLDIATTGVLLPLLGPVAGTGLLELVPGFDVVPTYTLATLYFLWQVRRRRGTLKDFDVPVQKPWRHDRGEV